MVFISRMQQSWWFGKRGTGQMDLGFARGIWWKHSRAEELRILDKEQLKWWTIQSRLYKKRKVWGSWWWGVYGLEIPWRLKKTCEVSNKCYLVLPASSQPGPKALFLILFLFLCFSILSCKLMSLHLKRKNCWQGLFPLSGTQDRIPCGE